MKGWRTVRLADVAKVGAGNSAPQDKALFEGGTYPFFRTADVGRVKVGELSSAQDHLNERGIKGLRLHSAGTVLIPKSGASTFLDHRVIMTVDGYVSSHLATLYANEDLLDCRYLFWAMQTISARDVSTDTSYPTLSLGQIGEILIPLPPLEEQRRIVAVLDEAFAAIATATTNAEKNLANAQETRALLHSRAFAEVRERQALGDLASFRNGVNFTSTSRGEEVRIVGVKDFQNNLFVPDEDLATVRVDGTLPNDDLLRAGDILTVRSNGNKALIGRCMIAANVEERTTHSGFTIRIRANGSRVDPEYLCRYLKSPEARERLVAGGAGANISSLNQKVLASLPVPVPSVVDQRRIVGTLSEVDDWSERLEALSQAKLVQLTVIKQSLLHSAFCGELTEGEALAA